MVSLQSAFSNDVSFEAGFSATLDMYLEPKDVVLIFSVSGKSPNIIQAIASARRLGSRVTGVVGRSGEHLRSQADVLIVLESLDYQIVENVQLAIMHWLTKKL
jgi:phosphoheptose isomerase